MEDVLSFWSVEGKNWEEENQFFLPLIMLTLELNMQKVIKSNDLFDKAIIFSFVTNILSF